MVHDGCRDHTIAKVRCCHPNSRQTALHAPKQCLQARRVSVQGMVSQFAKLNPISRNQSINQTTPTLTRLQQQQAPQLRVESSTLFTPVSVHA